MKTRTLTDQQIKAEPYCVWNAYIDLIAMEDYGDLSPEQRPAHLVFSYESEVQNGGHFQFFENGGTERLAETIAALRVLGATDQGQVLHEAGELWRSQARPRIQSAEGFCCTAMEGEFDLLDARFHACSPTLVECLEAHLKAHPSLFITIS